MVHRIRIRQSRTRITSNEFWRECLPVFIIDFGKTKDVNVEIRGDYGTIFL